jgi:hypothetical protein
VVFASQTNDYNNAISVIDEAIALLETVRDGDSSLIETESVQQLGKRLGESLNTLQSSRRIFFHPLVRTLTVLAEQKYLICSKQSFADQQLLQKVLGLLNELRASLVNNK